MENKKIVYLNLVIGIIFIFGLGALWHFIYQWSGNCGIIGLIAPINESVWEHIKLSLFPTIMWWVLAYFLFKNKIEINKNRWFLAMLTSLISAIILMPSIYYLYNSGFNINNFIVDIILFLIVTILSQLMAWHVYIHARSTFPFWISITFALIIIMAFAVLSIHPLSLPIFNSPV